MAEIVATFWLGQPNALVLFANIWKQDIKIDDLGLCIFICHFQAHLYNNAY